MPIADPDPPAVLERDGRELYRPVPADVIVYSFDWVARPRWHKRDYRLCRKSRGARRQGLLAYTWRPDERSANPYASRMPKARLVVTAVLPSHGFSMPGGPVLVPQDRPMSWPNSRNLRRTS